MKIPQKNVSLFFLQLLWLGIISAIFAILIKGDSFDQNRWTVYLCIMISMIIGIYQTQSLSGKGIHISTLFLIITYIFHHGQHLLGFFGINPSYYSMFLLTNFSDSETVSATVFSIVAINCLQLGFCIFLRPNYQQSRNELDTENTDCISETQIKNWAIIMFVVTIVPTILYDINRMVRALTVTYAQTYTYGSNSITVYASGFFEIAIIALIYCGRNNGKWKYVYYSRLIWNLLKLFFIGNRMEPISSIIALYFFKSAYVKEEKRISPIKIFVIAFGGLFLMGFISVFRAEKGNVSILSAVVEAVTTRNIILSFLTESGATLIDQKLLCELIPTTIPYAKGLTYVYSFLTLIPFSSSFLGTDMNKYISLGSLLNQHWYGGGLGGSMIAEGYYNFGWYSVILFFLLAYAITMFQKHYIKTINNKQNILVAIILTFVLEQVFILPRGYFYSVIGNLNIGIYSIVLYWIIKSVVSRKRV